MPKLDIYPEIVQKGRRKDGDQGIAPQNRILKEKDLSREPVSQTIVKVDDDLALLVQKIHQTNAKRKFYNNLTKDPASFVKRWISSQQRDLEIILAEATRGGGEDATNEEFRRGGRDGVWGSELARESVGLWLARNSKPH